MLYRLIADRDIDPSHVHVGDTIQSGPAQLPGKGNVAERVTEGMGSRGMEPETRLPEDLEEGSEKPSNRRSAKRTRLSDSEPLCPSVKEIQSLHNGTSWGVPEPGYRRLNQQIELLASRARSMDRAQAVATALLMESLTDAPASLLMKIADQIRQETLVREARIFHRVCTDRS
jgi:hypothetical protein